MTARQRADRARYRAALNLAVIELMGKWSDRVSYPELIAGLAETCADRLSDFARRTG